MSTSSRKFPYRLVINLIHGIGNNAHFETEAAAMTVLDRFSEALAKVRDYSNGDDADKVFRFSAAGARYAVDLRKAIGAVLELPEWEEVAQDQSTHNLRLDVAERERLADQGLLPELERRERLRFGKTLAEA